MRGAHSRAARGRWYDGGERPTRIPALGAEPERDALAKHCRVQPFDVFRAAVEAALFLLTLALMMAPLAFLCFVPTFLHMRGR
jgi:hypothetical protein